MKNIPIRFSSTHPRFVDDFFVTVGFLVPDRLGDEDIVGVKNFGVLMVRPILVVVLLFELSWDDMELMDLISTSESEVVSCSFAFFFGGLSFFVVVSESSLSIFRLRPV